MVLKTAIIWLQIIVIASALPAPGMAQVNSSPAADEYTIEMLSTKQGLPSAEIITLMQDSKGFVWVGTGLGLSRYDGLFFENFITCNNRPLGKVYGIIEDPAHHTLWILSDAGLCLFGNGTLTPVTISDDAVEVYDICLIEQQYWMATSKGVARFSRSQIDSAIQKKYLDFIIANEWKKGTGAIVSVKKITPGPDNTIWFMNRNSLYYYNGQIIQKKWKTDNPNDRIVSILQHPGGKFFFTTAQKGIFLLEGVNAIPVAVMGNFSANLQLKNNTIFYYSSAGIYEMQPGNYQLTRINGIDSAYSHSISTLLVDREQNFWAGTSKGILVQQKKLIHGSPVSLPTGSDITSTYLPPGGGIMWGSRNGTIYGKEQGKPQTVLLKKLNTRSEITSILADTRNRHWYSTGVDGVFMEGAQKTFHFTQADGLGADENFFFMEDSAGNIWTGGDGALTKFTTDSSNTVRLRSYRSLLKGNNWFTFINGFEGPQKRFWFAGAQGIFFIQNDSLTHYNFPGNPVILNVSDIKKDAAGFVWISTQGQGLWHCYFDSNGQLLVKNKLSARAGLYTDIYLKLLCDSAGVVWAAHSSGITRIEQRRDAYLISNYNSRAGFPANDYNNIWITQPNKQSVWITTSSETARLDPRVFTTPVITPLLELTHISSDDSTYYPESFDSAHTRTLSFPFHNNNLSFHFASAYFQDPGALKLLYRLSGTDTGWKNGSGNRTIAFEQLAPGNYVLQAYAVTGNSNKSKTINIQFSILQPFWKTGWFLLSAAGIIIGLLWYWIKHREKNIRTAIAEKAAVRKQITELEIKALKSQMNPHFVFNSLNSIAHLIASNQTEKAFEYLAKFSKLLRMILNEAENSFVLLKDEIKMLQLYLQIEALRFGDSFTYTIDMDEDIEKEEVLVPALLTHPIVENAIWHGLLHKTGARKLSIGFTKIDDTILECIVTDNGIGVDAARSLKEGQLPGTTQKSKGLQLVKDRLKMLEEQCKSPCRFSINNAHEKNKAGMGTIVTIQFPVKYES